MKHYPNESAGVVCIVYLRIETITIVHGNTVGVGVKSAAYC